MYKTRLVYRSSHGILPTFIVCDERITFSVKGHKFVKQPKILISYFKNNAYRCYDCSVVTLAKLIPHDS